MASNSSYQPLHNQDDDDDIVDAGITNANTGTPSNSTSTNNNVNNSPDARSPPPPYVADQTSLCEAGGASAEPPSNELPPQYVDVVKLPTYNESENLPEDRDDDNETSTEGEPNNRFFFWFLHGDGGLGGQQRGSGGDDSRHETGSDAAFMFSFLLALIFNWLGFLVSYCFTRSLASYYGAIAGFGISLVKWAFIAQHSEWSRDFMVENPWFCYAFVLFGWVIFMRGIFAYIQMKRLVHRSNAQDAGMTSMFS